MARGLGGVGGVRLIALLNFYDEPAPLLVQCLTSLIDCCDHLVALDGGYELFPGAHRYSGELSSKVFTSMMRMPMGVTCSTPRTVWRGNEVEKRNALLKLGKAVAEEGDWFLVVDADMVVTSVPSNLKHVLSETDCDVGTYWLKDPIYGGRHPIRYLFRAADDLYIKTTHYGYRRGDTWLWEHGGLPAVETDLIIEHRGHLRSKERNARADEYDRLVQVHGIENAS